MNDSILKDRILSLLVENKNARLNSAGVAENLAVDDNTVIRLVSVINGENGNWIDRLPGQPPSIATISLNMGYFDQVTAFAASGGYVAIQAAQDKDNMTRELYTENLQLSNAAAHDARLNADKAESRARAANRAAWIASAAAVLAIVWDLIKTIFFQNK